MTSAIKLTINRRVAKVKLNDTFPHRGFMLLTESFLAADSGFITASVAIPGRDPGYMI